MGLILLLQGSSIFARELCRATLDCPPDFNGDTVSVGYDVVMLSEVFEHCAPDSIKEGSIDTTKDTISLFIIIDHSSSMQFMDPNSNRYRVVCELIDSIYVNSPASEIGMAVFSNKLLHNFETDTFFNQLDTSQAQGWNDSYVPFTRLDSQVGGMSAVDKLKWAIQLSDTALDIGGNKKLINADYGTSGRKEYNGGTDISLGFEAAKEAFQFATYEKKRQFIILFSDGVHQLIDSERQPYAIDYVSGVNTPTTFTAFFINQGQPIPDTIKIMTDNIKNNGYSENNTFSKVWGTQAQESEFFDKLLNNIVGEGLKYFTSIPISLTINGLTTTTFDDSFAYYPPPFAPLNANGQLTLNVSYTWHWNDPINMDVTEDYTVYIVQSDIPDLESVDCWNQGSIAFYYQASQIAIAGPNQLLIEVRFFPPDSGNFPPLGNTVDLELTNADASDKLNVTLSLHPVGSYYTMTFSREYASPVADAVLQNNNIDSIVAIYRNPAIPLDTIRYAIKVLPLLDMTVNNAYYLDQDANGHPDIVRMVQGDGQVLTNQDCAFIKPYTSFYGPRNVGATDSLIPAFHGFDIFIPESPATQPAFTGIYYDKTGGINERVFINCEDLTLPSGGNFPYTDTTINDSMAPVINRAIYLDLFDTTAYDTLKVVLSEEVKTIGHIEPFKFNRIPAITEYKLKLTHLSIDSTFAVFAVMPISGQVVPQSGDSIWINEFANVSDVIGNTQNNTNNIRRKLGYYFILTIESSIYLDTSSCPDGLIDMIQVNTDIVPDSAMLEALLSTITLPDHHNFTVTGIVATDSGFAILVSQPDGTVPVTGVDPLKDSLTVDYTLSTTNGIIIDTKIPIKDGVAPVIIKAVFCPKHVTQEGSTVYDTLIITFSEAVTPPPYDTDTPFVFSYVSGGQEYTMVLLPLSSDEDGQVQTFLVLSSGKQFPEDGDPVWIDSIAGIADLVGNVQDNPNNKAVPLIVKPYHFSISVSIGPNPGDFTQIVTINNEQKQGILIKVNVIGGWPSYVTMTCFLHVFDVVGNEISYITGIPSVDKKYFYFVWDGINQYYRKVADGMYLGLISIKSSQGIKKTETAMIGVKRNTH